MNRLLFFLERNRTKLETCFLYAVLIPFLRPKGFDEGWGWYKTFFTLWLYAAMVMILILVVHDAMRNGLRYKPCAYAMGGYYILFVLITLIQQGGIHEGTQKMFAAPALYLMCMVYLKRSPKKFLIAVVNILTVIFALNVTVLCPVVVDWLIHEYHVNFLGHVQVAAQYGLLGCFAAYLLWKMEGKLRRRCILLVALSLIQTLWAGTSAGLLMLMILAAGMFLRSRPRLRGLVLMNPQVYYLGYVAINLLMLLFAFSGLDSALGVNISFSGRTEVWREAFKLIVKHPFLGYGAYGVQIITSWSNGMNYAHNEFVQRLLDGGIVLCVAYVVMLYFFVREAQGIPNKKVRSFANICLTGMLFVMLFESVTDYYFVAFFFALLAYTPEIVTYRKNKWGGDAV